jgi:chromosome segregation ATPase
MTEFINHVRIKQLNCKAMRQILAIGSLALLMAISCVPKAEKEQLEMENEELRAELARAQMAAATLDEVGSLMDSIDQARSALRIELEAGTDYDDYVDRMNAINEYVAHSEAQLTRLEQELDATSQRNQAYIKTIKRLKKDLEQRTREIGQLQATVEKYKEENTSLLNMVDMRETQIDDLEQEITMKLEELDLLENRMQEMMRKAQVSEADSYFALGEALAEAARRTRLAPKKKKETYREAIEYFEKAKAFGREDAQAQIDALQKRL